MTSPKIKNYAKKIPEKNLSFFKNWFHISGYNILIKLLIIPKIGISNILIMQIVTIIIPILYSISFTFPKIVDKSCINNISNLIPAIINIIPTI